MSKASDLLRDLRQRGFILARVGNGIRVQPSSELTDELRQAIRGLKADLIALLDLPPCPTCGEAGQRLGRVVIDGKARYICNACDIVWWTELTGEPTDGSWERAYPEISDTCYEAVVAHDLLTFGQYRPDRCYNQSTPTPDEIWRRLQTEAHQ